MINLLEKINYIPVNSFEAELFGGGSCSVTGKVFISRSYFNDWRKVENKKNLMLTIEHGLKVANNMWALHVFIPQDATKKKLRKLRTMDLVECLKDHVSTAVFCNMVLETLEEFTMSVNERAKEIKHCFEFIKDYKLKEVGHVNVNHASINELWAFNNFLHL